MQLPLPCTEIDNYAKYEVEKVLDLQQRQDKLEYLTPWHGYDINKHT